MFLYNIAFSLEFIVLGLGALMIGWAQYKCAKWHMKCEKCSPVTTSNLGSNVTGIAPGEKNACKTHCKHGACGTGLVKGFGILLIILALANFGDTINNAIKFHKHRHQLREKIQMLRTGGSTTEISTPATPAGTTTNP